MRSLRRLYLGLARSTGGGGGVLPIAPLGVNLEETTYYSANSEYENLFLYDAWAGGTVGLPYVDGAGEMLLAPEAGGFPYFEKVMGCPRNAGAIEIKVTWTVTGGSPTISFSGSWLSNIVITGNSARMTYTFTDAGRNGLPFARIRVLGGKIGSLEARECDAGGNWLYPTARFNPDWIAQLNSRYAGGYIRFMDWMRTNGNWRGAGAAGGMRMDWANRALGPQSNTYSRNSAQVTLGTGNAGLLLTATDSPYSNLSQTILGTHLPKHWFGANGNNLRVQINAISGAGSASYSVVGDLFKVVLTPPSTATTTALVRDWINANTNLETIEGVFFRASLPSTSDGSSAFVPVAETAFAGGRYSGAPDGSKMEDIIEVCSLANVRPWICIPTSATADYATGLATLLNSTLPARCKPVRLEFSNEPWNSGFMAYHTIRAEGIKAGFADPHPEQHAARITELQTAVAAVMPSSDFIWVMGGFNALASYATSVLSKFTPSASTYVDRLAVAPYYNAVTYTSSETADQILDAQLANITTTLDYAAANETVAATYSLGGIDLYEGGVHTVIPSNLTKLEAVARSTRNEFTVGVYTAEIRRRFPNAVFAYFNDNYPLVTSLGYQWGLTEVYNASRATSPKLDGFLNVKEGAPPCYYAGITTGFPTVSGIRMVGSTLTVSQPTARNVTTTSWRWMRDGVAISGETGSTYVQVAADIGKVVECESTISNSNNSVVTTTTGGTATVAFTKYVKIVTTGTGTWTAPADMGASAVVHCIGAGGDGFLSTDLNNYFTGGGGGGWSKKTMALTANATYNYQIGGGGSGTDTWFDTSSTVLAKAGADGISASGNVAQGGQAASGIGDTKFSGGNGGTSTATFLAGAGGGGAAGPNGNGKNGADAAGFGGGGGGGANNGTDGAGADANFGGRGGNARDGTLGGVGGNGSTVGPFAGVNGSGGGGTKGGGFAGAAGSTDPVWTITADSSIVGPGSGSGGGGSLGAGAGGQFGGGSGGGRTATTAGQGLIIIEYAP